MTIDRREFLELACGSMATGALVSLPQFFAGHTADAALLLPSRLIPEDKGIRPEQIAQLKRRGERRVYRGTQRYAIGMPCGGLAAGQLYILGDGTLGGWHIDGRVNSTGYGDLSYRTHRAPRQLKQGFRLVIGDQSGLGRSEPRTWILADPESGGDFDDIEFIGEYPIAEIHYGSSQPRTAPPVEITLRAGSPFIPLNSRDSAMPCTLLRIRLTNRSGAAVSGALQGWLENGVEPIEPGQPAAVRRNQVMREAHLTSVLMDAIPDTDIAAPARPDRVLFDFEQADYKGWSVEGTAFGSGPAHGTQPNQNPVAGFIGQGLVNSYAGSDSPTGRMLSDRFTIDRRYLTFLIGAGRDPQRTCMHLLVDDKVVRTAAGKNNERLEPFAWDVSDLENREARLQIVDSASGPWGHINVDQIALVDRLPSNLQRPRPDSLTNGTMALSFLGEARATAACDPDSAVQIRWDDLAENRGADSLVAVIEAPFHIEAGQSVELTFVVAWQFPNLHTGQGQMYTNWFADALEVIRYVASNAPRLIQETELFHRTFYADTTLPWWLALRVMMPVANLATGTVQWWKNGRCWAWEGVGCCHGTCTHVWNYAQAEARLFPDLARSTRLMQDLESAFEESTGRVAFRGEVKGGSEFAADGQAGTILKCFREHLTSADHEFLKAKWPRIKLAMQYLIARDAEQSPDHLADGIILGRQPNTYDIDFVGANTFIGSLYLAALHASAAMADQMKDWEFAAQCRAIAAAGRKWTEHNLFNGEYFVQKTIAGDTTPFQYGDGCLSDQVFGQNWARTLGLPPVYDEDMIRQALRSVYRFNWAPAVGMYNAEFPPERVFARDREAGLFVCTWPKGGRIIGGREPVRYRDEVWTGIEYQVAAGMIWEGMIDEGLIMVKAVDERYDGGLHNPWNEVECGDHYARSLASWGVLLALSGFGYDGPTGAMGMAPRIAPDDFASFFSAAEGWGRIEQKRGKRSQTNRVEVRWGRLRLSEFNVDLPDSATADHAQCEVRAADKVVAAVTRWDGGRFIAHWPSPLLVEAGHSLELRWTW